MHVTVLDVERIEYQVKEAGEDSAVLADRRYWVSVSRIDLHCGGKVC